MKTTLSICAMIRNYEIWMLRCCMLHAWHCSLGCHTFFPFCLLFSNRVSGNIELYSASRARISLRSFYFFQKTTLSEFLLNFSEIRSLNFNREFKLPGSDCSSSADCRALRDVFFFTSTLQYYSYRQAFFV
jgi:hypothetical protein